MRIPARAAAEGIDVADEDAVARMMIALGQAMGGIEMHARGRGQIVDVTSIGGRVSLPHMLPSSSAKLAAFGLSEGLHAELAGTGLRVLAGGPP